MAYQLLNEAANVLMGPTQSIPLPEETAATFRRLAILKHPSAGYLSQQKLDWSMVSVGRWRKRAAGGKVPGPLQGFAAAHHAGSIYVVGGAVMPTGESKEVHALDLSTMKWRSVQPKGGKAAMPARWEHVSSAVWRTSVCCFVPSVEPKIHLFDMANETWSKRDAPWPK